MYQHILLPTDGSAQSEKAAQAAVTFAKAMGARITAVFVTVDFAAVYPEFGLGYPVLPEAYEALLKEGATHTLDRVKALAEAAGVACTGLAIKGDSVHEAIIDAARNAGCDVIFMASHGRKGVAGLLLGSVTHKVLTHCQIPVLVYRRKEGLTRIFHKFAR